MSARSAATAIGTCSTRPIAAAIWSGAGGTRCPVHRAFFRELAPREEALQAAVLEEEFAYDWSDGTCRLWFFERGLPGYGWYVPKAGGHLNVGIGAMAPAAEGQAGHDPAALAAPDRQAGAQTGWSASGPGTPAATPTISARARMSSAVTRRS